MFERLNGKILSHYLIKNYFPVKKHEKVLVLGCGFNPEAVIYKDSFKEMHCIDIQEGKIEFCKKAREKFRIENCFFIAQDIKKLNFKNNEFDKVFLLNTVEHLKNPIQCLKEASRVLKPSGSFLISFPLMWYFYTDNIRKLSKLVFGRNFSKAAEKGHPDCNDLKLSLPNWITLIESGGFKVEKMRPSTMFPPLHLYGLPRFYYSNKFIRFFDNLVCESGLFNSLGQSIYSICTKKEID